MNEANPPRRPAGFVGLVPQVVMERRHIAVREGGHGNQLEGRLNVP